MAAAEHLKEVLVLKEQRELIELKAAVRLVDAQSNLATTEQPEPIQETVTAEQAADRFLKSLKARRTDE